MRSVEADEAMRLDHCFDEMLSTPNQGTAETRSGTGQPIDAGMADVLHFLHEASTRPSPAPHFVQGLGEALIKSDPVVPQVRVIPVQIAPPDEQSRRACPGSDVRSNSILRREEGAWWRIGTGPTNDGIAHDSLPVKSPIPVQAGHHPSHPTAPSRQPWWRHCEMAATILLVVALGGAVLLVANPGRGVPAPSQLSALQRERAGAEPRVLDIFDIGVFSLVEPSTPLGESTTADENIWATGWRDGQAVPMTEPNDPLAVSWLAGSTVLGEGGNVVLQGHNEYWNSDSAVFAELDQLTPESLDPIRLTSVNDVTFAYGIEWVRRFPSHVTPDVQREILGPTDKESLTLITPGGSYDARTGTYPEVVVVRAEHLWTDGLTSIEIPDPTTCEVTPRSTAELDALALRFNNDPTLRPTATPPDALTGVPADPATAAAVTNTARTLAACLNANDALRSYALYSDNGLVRPIALMMSASFDPTLEWAPDFFPSPDVGTPVPPNEQLVVWSVDDVRILDDGRVSAIVEISASQGSQLSGMSPGERALYIFARTGGRYYYYVVDEVIFPPPE